MKPWQIFAVGTAALLLFLFLPYYESVLGASAAIVLLSGIVVGFLLRPKRDLFNVITTAETDEIDDLVSIEHECLAIKVELARLWLLFIPTFLAMAFLIVRAARGTWKVSLLQYLDAGPSYWTLMGFRFLLMVVVGTLTVWISERWVLKHADLATTAEEFSGWGEGRVSYAFRNKAGEFYGGECFVLLLAGPTPVARVILYSSEKPERNKLGGGLLFHRLVIIGRGITDLDVETSRTLTTVKRQTAES